MTPEDTDHCGLVEIPEDGDEALLASLDKLIFRQRDKRGDMMTLGEADPEIIQAKDRILSLLSALEDYRKAVADVKGVIESGYRGVDKAEICPHGKYGFEDCIACYDEALLSPLSQLPCQNDGGGRGQG